MADLVNAQLFYEAIARIISSRTGTQITATVQKGRRLKMLYRIRLKSRRQNELKNTGGAH